VNGERGGIAVTQTPINDWPGHAALNREETPGVLRAIRKLASRKVASRKRRDHILERRFRSFVRVADDLPGDDRCRPQARLSFLIRHDGRCGASRTLKPPITCVMAPNLLPRASLAPGDLLIVLPGSSPAIFNV